MYSQNAQIESEALFNGEADDGCIYRNEIIVVTIALVLAPKQVMIHTFSQR